MPDTITPNLNMVKPEIGASDNTWGNKLNGNFDILDQVVVKQTYQWKVQLGDGIPGSSTGPYVVSRYGNDSIKIDDPFTMNRQTGDANFANNLSVVKQFLSSVGTALLPAYAFLVEPALGFYRIAAGKIAFTGRLVGNGIIPPGFILDFAGPTPPSGWLECNGASLLVADQPDLFNAIGYTWGGSGANFNLPNSGDRFRRNRGSAAGAVGTLQTSQNLSHLHVVAITTGSISADHTHTFSGTTSGMSANNPHSHALPGAGAPSWGGGNPGVTGSASIGGNPPVTGTVATDINHSHSFSGNTAGVSTNHTHNVNGNTASDGGAEARPLSMTVLTCIKT